MHTSNSSPDILLMKEMFINHKPSQIQKDYEIDPKSLGQGGFGIVYAGKKKSKYIQGSPKKTTERLDSTSSAEGKQNINDSEHTQDLRAIKKISFQKIQNKKMMENEIQILSYLDHPSILKLYDTYEYKQSLYLVTDLLKGGDLFKLVDENQNTNEEQVKVIFEQLIRAIGYLHAQHICHRDLKLENVLFLDQNTYNLKLIDFGLAFCWDDDMRKELKQSGENKILAGTPDYMSPEILAYNYDQRCDIWAAGVILYLLLSGTPPFVGDSDKQIMKNIKRLNYSLETQQFKQVSQQAKDLISKILKPQKQRISISQILAHPWFLTNSELDKLSCNTNRSIRSRKSSISMTNNNKPQKKFRTTRSYNRLVRNTSDASLNNIVFKDQDQSQSQLQKQNMKQNDQPYESSQEDVVSPESLTVDKLQHYLKLSRLQKLFSIYSVSKLGQSRLCKYGLQFVSIDKDNDGTISLNDLKQYLLEIQQFSDQNKIQEYFRGLDLSKRDFINYSEYLACVLAYPIDEISSNLSNISEQLDQSESPIFKKKCGINDIMQIQEKQFPRIESNVSEYSRNSAINTNQKIDIFSDNFVFSLFDLLDKDKDGKITLKDISHFFQNNGVNQENSQLLQEMCQKYKEIIQYKESQLKSINNKRIKLISSSSQFANRPKKVKFEEEQMLDQSEESEDQSERSEVQSDKEKEVTKQSFNEQFQITFQLFRQMIKDTHVKKKITIKSRKVTIL